MSPLAEGRELKYPENHSTPSAAQSPLAEGRELKYMRFTAVLESAGRPSRRGVN